MKRDKLTMIDWNGPFNGESVPTVNPRKGNAFYRTRTSPRLRAWEVALILAACAFALGCLVWAKG